MNIRKKYPELTDILKKGKHEADAEIENSLFKRAVGFTYEETKIIIEPTGKVDNKGNPITKRRVEKTTKHVIPYTTAIIFYLKNRKSQDWHDRKQNDIYEDQERDINITVTHEKGLSNI